MKKIYLFTLISLVFLFKAKAQMGINKDGSAPHSSAMLDIKASSTTNAKGLLMPRVADHTVITSPATGLMVFNTTTNTFWYYNGTAWADMGSGGNNAWSVNGTNVFTNNNVGINTSTPQTTLDVKGDGFLVSQKTKLTTEDPNLHVYNMPLSNITYNDAAGILYDPSGPTANYPSGNINTTTTIANYATNSIGIKLTFEVFDTEANGDSVIITNGLGQTLAKYSGNTLPSEFLYNATYMQIKFKTNGNSTVGQGFKIKWQRIDRDGGIYIPINGLVGNNVYFDASAGAFRSGNIGQASSENLGLNSVAMGYGNRASSDYAVAIGYSNNASSSGSIAMGTNSNATGYNSTAIGYYTNATSTNSFASGYQTRSGGYASTAMGDGTVSSNSASFAAGYRSNSTGYASTALGYFTTASNTGSFASGYRASANGYVSSSLGNFSNASGNGSFATGYSTNANGEYSTALGAYTIANGYYSSAMGLYSTASGYVSVALGYGSNVTSNSSYGTSMGYYTTASSTASFASGYQSISGGYASTSMGNNTNASGYCATALGNQTNASGYLSTAMGTGTTATGFATTSTGYNTAALGDNSTTMGSAVTANQPGAFVIGDAPSFADRLFSPNSNSFSSRFRNGYFLYTSSNLTTGAILYGGSNSWSTVSDSTKKENFLPIDGEKVLKKIANIRTVTWNYKGQDPKSFRHYGPMAQEFFNAFGRDKLGVIGNDTTIASADFDGINFTAIKALEKRTTELQTENENLKKRLALLEKSSSEIMVLKAEMEQLKALLLPAKEKIKAKVDSDK